MGKRQLGFDFFSDDSFENKTDTQEKQPQDLNVAKKSTIAETPVSETNEEPVTSEEVAASSQPPVSSEKNHSTKRPNNMFFLRQAVLRWLVSRKPTGIGVKVPTRIRKYQVEAAAFWSVQDKLKKRAEKTALVEVCNDRDHCWPDCSDLDTLLRNIRELKEEKQQLEEIIRAKEPELKERDTLFDEFQRWNYSASRNRKYQKCIKQIDRAHHSLYKGSRLELIRQAHVADFIYVAVPEGVIHPHELVDGWGLLYITPNGEITEEKKAQRQTCSLDSRMHLIQNIAASCMNSALFANGVNLRNNGEVFLTKPPRRRRK
ncbi:MAG: hypothetical protein GY750_09570 [Lentisphaerae bacterium]|nr:hypothetical protein [Lentisphaerota bacterium]MCP4101661.1 hypothetical protein [Lentisphaerota bacterium]